MEDGATRQATDFGFANQVLASCHLLATMKCVLTCLLKL